MYESAVCWVSVMSCEEGKGSEREREREFDISVDELEAWFISHKFGRGGAERFLCVRLTGDGDGRRGEEGGRVGKSELQEEA